MKDKLLQFVVLVIIGLGVFFSGLYLYSVKNNITQVETDRDTNAERASAFSIKLDGCRAVLADEKKIGVELESIIAEKSKALGETKATFNICNEKICPACPTCAACPKCPETAKQRVTRVTKGLTKWLEKRKVAPIEIKTPVPVKPVLEQTATPVQPITLVTEIVAGPRYGFGPRLGLTNRGPETGLVFEFPVGARITGQIGVKVSRDEWGDNKSNQLRFGGDVTMLYNW